jgi:hypothetical protein
MLSSIVGGLVAIYDGMFNNTEEQYHHSTCMATWGHSTRKTSTSEGRLKMRPR